MLFEDLVEPWTYATSSTGSFNLLQTLCTFLVSTRTSLSCSLTFVGIGGPEDGLFAVLEFAHPS